MAKKDTTPAAENYVRLEGSERRPSPNSKLLGPADLQERITVTIVLQRKPDAEPVPGFAYFQKTPPSARPRLSQEEFAQRYGASEDDIKKVADFARSQGLNIEETNAARRSVVASGTVEQMSKAFGVSLSRYEHSVSLRRGQKPVTQTYRGRDGFIHVPQDLAQIIVGVFGLDDRSITKRNAADPPGTTTITVPQVRQLYNFPSNTADNQTIAIFCGLTEFGDGYDINDVQNYFAGLPSGFPQPTITDISVHGSNSGSDPFGEITQDIDICGSAAPGAAIAVYFTSHTQQGWVDCIQRVIHPNAGDPICSVLSSSYYVCDGDDATGITHTGASTAWINAVTALFQDAAIQGVTVCIATGDTGTDSKVGDGKAHVQYPASDPWVLAVGGTTVGNVSGSSFDEYVWNDTFFGGQAGATGGGISDFFSQPSYQSGAGVPPSLNDGHTGRGLPDVAANASPNSGYPITVGGAASVGNGTSASAPLWAGLIATINAALGENVGFVNPAIYEIGSAGFRDIVGSPGPTDNGLNGVAGYPAGPGWDACTGWGSPDGTALLNSLHTIYNRTLYFIVDKSTFGKDEVADVISVGGGLYPQAFWVVLEGFSIQQLGSLTPALGGAFDSISGVSIFLDAAGAEYEDPSNLYAPQRVRFPYDIIFSSSALAAFPASGSGPIEDLLTASITVAGTTLSAEALFELVSGADPYFTNIDPSHNNEFYLSQDLRVFSVANGDTPLPGGPTMSGSDPYSFIQNLLGFMNGNPTYTTPGPDPLNALPGQSGYETGDSSVTPLNPSNNQNFNFAIARVRLQDTALATAPDVRVFFRLWVAQSFDTDFQPSTTYKSVLGTTGADGGKPIFPLPSGTGLMDPSGQSVQSIPFFATDGSGTHDYDSSVPNANIRNIQVPAGRDKVWAYFGCFLDVYDASNQSKFPGTHHCIVSEIAYDDAPIINSGGVTESPENSDKLAQRNLQITSSGNPSYPLTHRVPQAFDMRPSKPVSSNAGLLLNYPDELMIDWGKTPVGSVARLYWPQINASDVLDMATSLYGTHSFTASDANTIQCTVVKGITYIPIPADTGKNFAGLFTVDLPSSVRVGQEFRIKVRRVSSRQFLTAVGGTQIGPQINAEAGAFEKGHVMRNWRYVTGTFQVTIPVGTDETLLPPEETALAVLKWRQEHMSPAYRWYPVLQRFVAYVSGRVQGFGGDPASIKPSLQGVPAKTKRPPKALVEGKVCEVVYDCFGDFRGFVLQQCCSERRFFECCEEAIGELALRACKERLKVTVCADEKHDHKICEIRIGC
jgi:hypothetical protein